MLLAAVVVAQETEPLKTDSRAPYVHRITLYAGDGAAISPKDPNPPPYSPRATCGKCHPYAEIRDGWHFNAVDPDVPAGRPGEPWFLVDEKAGTVSPISGRRWPGTVTPQDAGLSHWQFVLRFGHHTPGGGYGTPDSDTLRGARERDRWRVSGALEIDCMMCHSANQQHDPAELARQIEKENFQWAPTIALGLGVLRGEARKLPDDFDPEAPPDPDYPDRTPPKLVYDRRLFDLDDRVLFNITRRPSPERCYFCHSFREVGPGATDDMLASRDVHLAAGLTCVDCHRNEMDHEIVRGYDTEAAERGEPWRAAFSCAGCHLGATAAPAGRYGAPRPEHRGLPPVHFDKLTCTACHSGPWPDMDARRFQTALAHGLGLPTRERRAAQAPEILGPVFARQQDGKIAPQRLVWTNDGSKQPADEVYRWSIAHDVRPASQSLGVRGCEDCHAADGPMFFGRVPGPNDSPGDTMLGLRGDDAALEHNWVLAFRLRPIFKILGCACAGVLALVLLRMLSDGITARFVAATATANARNAALQVVSSGAAVLGTAVGVATTWVPEWLGREPEGYLLLAHMVGGGLFLAGMTAGAICWSPRPAARARAALVWLVFASGWGVLATMLVGMLPLVGTDGQRALADWHEWAAIALLASGALYFVLARLTRRAKGTST